MQLSVNAQFDFDGISVVLDRHGFGNHGIVQKDYRQRRDTLVYGLYTS